MSYQRPTPRRVIKSIVLVVETLERTENTKLVLRAVRSTFRRPQVSAMNPQKWDVNTTPIKATALINPCSELVRCISHLADGSTKAIFRPSRTTPSKANPVVNNRAK